MINIKEKIVDYLLEKFTILNRNKEVTRKFVDSEFDNCIYALQDNNIIGVCFYFWLNDETVDKVARKEIKIDVADNYKVLKENYGDNIHIYALATDFSGLVVRGFKDLMRNKKPKTISWWNQGLEKFCILRNKKCLKSY